MQWFLLGVVVIALLYMSTHYPKTAFGILGALGLGAAVIVFSTQDNALRGRSRLPVGDIQIENAVMLPAYGGSYQFNARLLNAHASILLKESVVSITMLDCWGQGDDAPDDAPDDMPDDTCAVIGQTDERFDTKIPPGQARDISRNLFFSGAKPSGTVRWQYQITETRS